MSLENEDIVRLREIFVTRKECNDDMDAVNRNNAQTQIELELIKQQLKIITWVSKTTLAAVIAAIVGFVLNQIFK